MSRPNCTTWFRAEHESQGAGNVLITLKIVNVTLESVSMRVLAYLIPMWILIVIVAAFPKFVLFLPNLLLW